MVGLTLLPTPLEHKSLALGQLLTDPLNPSAGAFLSSIAVPTQQGARVQSDFTDVLHHDDEGRFLSSVQGCSPASLDGGLVVVAADRSEHALLKHPPTSFSDLYQDSAARTWLRQMAFRRKPLYYVVGLQKLRNPTFHRAVVKEGSIAEASSDHKMRLPMHLRRDSAMDISETSNDLVYAVELRKVKCRVGPADEPHSLDDIDYSWSYSKLDDEDLQLAVGLGKTVEASELHALAGIVSGEDYSDYSYDGYYDISDDEGQGGFSPDDE